jgi:fibronectin-binding autotransporter adhesin
MILASPGGTAIEFAGSGYTLTLGAGYLIEGIVDPAGKNTLQLGGTGSDGFDLNSIGSGAQYRGFTTFNVVGGVWTVSGAGSAWNVTGGTLALSSGGILRDTTVRSGGTFVVSSGGTADPTRLLSSGAEIIASGGIDGGAQVSGGEQDVFGSASGTTVFGGSQIVESGGIATGTTVKNGGTLEVQFGAPMTAQASPVAASCSSRAAAAPLTSRSSAAARPSIPPAGTSMLWSVRRIQECWSIPARSMCKTALR